MSGGISDVLTNETLPKTEATITIRVIKSFEYRTERSLVLHKLNLETTTIGELKEIARQGMLQSLPAFSLHPISLLQLSHPDWTCVAALSQYRSRFDTYPKIVSISNPESDTFKLYTKAHGAKTTNLIINLDHDEWILDDGRKILAESGFENETEVSFFNRQAYENFKVNPEIRWES